MTRSLKTLRPAAALVAVMLGLVPLAGDLHFATTEHRWCPVHHHIEDLDGRSAQATGPTRHGVSRGHDDPADAGSRCPVLAAMRPVTRPVGAVVATAPPPRPALARAPAAPAAGRAILDRAPKHGPPAA